jgi:hypothetical protein
MGDSISEKREAELLDILCGEIHRRSLQKTVQTYPPCVCGSTAHIDYDHEFLPGKKGIMVKVARCLCGKKIFPRVEMLS